MFGGEMLRLAPIASAIEVLETAEGFQAAAILEDEFS
jgi:hypothetical protein